MRARPQSITYTAPKRPTMMFAGLRSRWITPLSCAYAIASQIFSTTSSTRVRDQPSRSSLASSITSRSVRPFTSFIVKYT